MKTITLIEIAEEHAEKRDKFVDAHLADLLNGRTEFARDIGWTINIEDIYCDVLADPDVYRDVMAQAINGTDDLDKLRAKIEEAARDALAEFYDDATND